MRRSNEQFLYNQHQDDAERVEKAKNAYNKNLAEARKAGDTTSNPELWDEASAEYQAETDKKIIEAVQNKDYGEVEELARGLRFHLKSEIPTEKVENAPVVNEMREKISGIISETDLIENKIPTEKVENAPVANEMREKISGIISETDLQKMREWINEGHLYIDSPLPSGIKAIAIEINPKGDFNFSEEDLQKIEIGVENARKFDNWGKLIYDLAKMRILTTFEESKNTPETDLR